ncbi:efflux transporter outer membrane subunit [Methylomonas sp. HYX-M1]|uniref:efflux transporter outer membrane subunit n=1 Tax=Methylomonas sp. HYX-M1 TaxID=3139307 RepID=UPI00345BF616
MPPLTRLPSRVWAAIWLSCLCCACARLGSNGDTPARMKGMPAIRQTLDLAGTEATAKRAWPEQNWWRQFNDPVLDRLIATALSDNPNIHIAAARLTQAQALVDARGAELYPTLESSLGFSAQRFSANSVQAKLAGEHFRQLLINPLVLRYHLDFWGHDRAALQSAFDRSLAGAAELADARLLLTAELTACYFDLQTSLAQTQLAERIAADRQGLLALQQAKRRAGLSGDAPTLQAEIALSEAAQELARLHGTTETQRNRLAVLAGRGADWGQALTIRPNTAAALLHLPTDLPLRLLSKRPDLSAARLQAEAAAEDVMVAETAFYPDVNLYAFSGLHSVSLTDLVLQGASLAYAVGPAIELPIFEGGLLRAKLTDRRAAYDAAVERYNAALLHAVQEVADSLSRWREFAARRNEQRAKLEAAAAGSRLAARLLQSGLADRLQVLQARIAENQEHLVLLGLEVAQRKVSVGLIKALGGGYDADSVKVSDAPNLAESNGTPHLP